MGIKGLNSWSRKGSYSFKEGKETKDQKGIWCKLPSFFKTFDPELKHFVLERLNGEKSRSINYRSGWNVDEHTIALSELVSRYSTNLENGLSDSSVTLNRKTFGENILLPPRQKSNVVKFLQNVLLGLNLLLWICGVVMIITAGAQYITGDMDNAIGSLYSGISLILVVIIAGSFAFSQEFKSNRVMESFRRMAPQTVTVIRSGRRQSINLPEVVVGDVVEVKYGDKLPADIRIIECQSFKVDNSSITGEADPQSRSPLRTDKDPMETKNLAFFSTNVVQGSAKGVVIKVGQATLIGRLAKLASSTSTTPSPLAKEMNRIVRLMTGISLMLGALFYLIGLSMNYTWLTALFFVIGIVVGNVPENLNVTLTIILGLAARKLAQKNCLVKNLQAVETLGSCSVILSDKTGTLTKNKMSVAHLWFNDMAVDADLADVAESQLLQIGNEERKDTYSDGDPYYIALSKVATLCSRATFKPGYKDVPVLTREAEGDSSEVAILRYMQQHFTDVETYRTRFPKVFEIPFNSINKYQLSVHQTDQGYLIAMKGAPEAVIKMCQIAAIGSENALLDHKMMGNIQASCNRLASLGERVLGFCDSLLPMDKYPPDYVFDEATFKIPKHSLRFVGLMSLIDPPRPAVPSAVLKCRSANVKVAIITGDHPVTAAAIAKAVNIISVDEYVIGSSNLNSAKEAVLPIPKALVLTGPELKLLSPGDLQYYILAFEELVFARTTPEQKYDIVTAYQSLGYTVGVTGDGVNDAPALKRADIGIAMGSGTEVAKEVADMVLLDDNFSTIVDGIEDGRLIFDNLKKLIRYTMADNVAETYCYIVYAMLRIPLPMSTIAMLFSTLFCDIFPAVSLAHEPAESDIMKLKPRNPKKDRLMGVTVLSYSYGQVGVIEMLGGFYAYLVTFADQGWLPWHLFFCQSKFESPIVNDFVDSYGQEWTYKQRTKLELKAQTAFFLSIVICQFANAICCKCRRLSIFQNGMRNKLMNVGLVLMISVPCIFIYTPYLNEAVSFVPLGYDSWIASIPFAVFLFIYDELRRLIVRLKISNWVAAEFSS